MHDKTFPPRGYSALAGIDTSGPDTVNILKPGGGARSNVCAAIYYLPTTLRNKGAAVAYVSGENSKNRMTQS